MAQIFDLAAKIDDVTETTISISHGGQGQVISRADLANWVAGIESAPNGFLHNLAIALRMRNVNLNDERAIEDVLNKQTFKAFR